MPDEPELSYPPPPFLERFPGSECGSNGGFFVGLGTFLVGLGLLAWVIFELQKENFGHRAFIARCIEFQTLDRCGELYRYGRQDLMEQRR